MRPLTSLLMALALLTTQATSALAMFGPARLVRYVEGVVVKDPTLKEFLNGKYRVVLVEKPGTPEEMRYLIPVPEIDIRALSLFAKLEQSAVELEPGSDYADAPRFSVVGACMQYRGHNHFELISETPSQAELTSRVVQMWKARALRSEGGAAEAMRTLQEEGLLEEMVQDLLEQAR